MRCATVRCRVESRAHTRAARSQVAADLGRLLGQDRVLRSGIEPYLRDATESRGLRGAADAVVLPRSAEEVATTVAWCYEREVPIVPRGGGTGFAGGAVPVGGGVVVSLERMARARSVEPLLWRMEVEAGMTTAAVHRLARENGLAFPPDPGAAESSQIGGNVATNAGGPHAFKYGVTGAWVTGLEAVVAPGEVIRAGGAMRKDVAAYDLKSLLIGSEGTLGIITAVWLRLIPAPEASYPLIGFYPTVERGCEAIERVFGSGTVPAALEYLDGGTLTAARHGFPAELPAGAAFAVIVEADGTEAEARASRTLLEAALEDADVLHAPTDPHDVDALWSWRHGVSLAVTARRGGKVSEDIAVPVESLGTAIAETLEIGRRHGLESLSWGHAGDGNLHSSFLLTPGDGEQLRRAEQAAAELFELAVRLGGSVSGEHGLGLVKNGQLVRQIGPLGASLHEGIKALFDPKGLFNPGKKLA
jgi:glycolate oxidase subunit GlcD